MSTTRLFSPVSLQAGSAAILGEEQARYVGKVLRLGCGDPLHVFDRSGALYKASIVSARKAQLVLQIDERMDGDVESPLAIHLLQCVSRGERMDFVVQKATELGASRITPLLSEFSVVKLDQRRAEKRREHWSRIAISACEQCGRNRVPDIDLPITLRNWLGINSASHAVPGLRIALLPGAAANLSELGNAADAITLLVGPEGGLSQTEHEQLTAGGFAVARLGPRILRTETAAIAALAALQMLYGDLGHP